MSGDDDRHECRQDGDASKGSGHRPVQRGSRFSKNAAMPSATSLVVVSSDSCACIASSADGSGGVSDAAVHACLPSRTATGAAAASFATYAATSASNVSAGKTRETNPIAYAVLASKRSPVSM